MELVFSYKKNFVVLQNKTVTVHKGFDHLRTGPLWVSLFQACHALKCMIEMIELYLERLL